MDCAAFCDHVVVIVGQDVHERLDHAEIEGLRTVLGLLRQERERSDRVEADQRVVVAQQVDERLQTPELPDGGPHGVLVRQVPDHTRGFLDDCPVRALKLPDKKADGPRLRDREAVLLGLGEGEEGAEHVLDGGHEGGELQDRKKERNRSRFADLRLDRRHGAQVPESARSLLLQDLIRWGSHTLDEQVHAACVRDRQSRAFLHGEVRERHRRDGPQGQRQRAGEHRHELADAVRTADRRLALVLDGEVEQRAHRREPDVVRVVVVEQPEQLNHSVHVLDPLAVGRVEREVPDALGCAVHDGRVRVAQELQQRPQPVFLRDLSLVLVVHAEVLQGARRCSYQRVRVALEELHEPPGAPELVDLASVRLVQCEVLQAVRGALPCASVVALHEHLDNQLHTTRVPNGHVNLLVHAQVCDRTQRLREDVRIWRVRQVQELLHASCVQDARAVRIDTREVPNHFDRLLDNYFVAVLVDVKQIDDLWNGLQLTDLVLIVVVQREARERSQRGELDFDVRGREQAHKPLEPPGLANCVLILIVVRKLLQHLRRGLLDAILRAEETVLLPPEGRDQRI